MTDETDSGTPQQEMHDIGWALCMLRNGYQIGRSGWNGKGMLIALQIPDENSKMGLPYVYIKTADNRLVPWLCSQTDLLASDWETFPVKD